ncbi:MAG TPA: ABC transporter permease [Vicinamibacterales bacterium]|nr:ABC transporter permease [Vicinamibacterales bacterium]
MTALRQDFRYALRSLLKTPVFVAVAVLTLAVGVGANTAIFSVLHAVVLRDLPYREADRLAYLWSLNLRQNLTDGSSYLNVRDWKEQSRAFADMVVYRRTDVTRATVTGGQEPERIQVALVGPGFFQLLGTPPILGRTLEAADFDEHSAIVISHALWRQRFASDSRVIGRTLDVDRVPCQIVGVMPSEFQLPGAEVQLWRPISVMSNWTAIQTDPQSRDGDPLNVIGRLRPGASFESARTEMNAIAARLRDAYPEHNAERGILIETLTDRVIGSRTTRSLWLLFGAVGLVLLIACANVANLALARGAARANEFSLRTALGASRFRLIRQTLTESLVLGLMGAGVGLLFATLAMALLRTWTAGALPRMETVRLDVQVFLFALAVALLCSVLAGVLPAWMVSTATPADALRQGGPRAFAGRSNRRVRHALVIAEMALAVVLLTGAGLLIRSFMRLQSVDRGFAFRNVLLLQVDLSEKFRNRGAYFQEALERIRALPGVAAAGAVTDFFIERHGDSTISVEGRPPRRDEITPSLIRDRASPGFFEAMRVPLLAGRLLRASDLAPNAPRIGVINEAMARAFWPGEDPVGRRLRWGGDTEWTTVVGVIADMKRQRLDDPAMPAMFQPGYSGQMDLAVRTIGDPAALRDAIRAELRAIDPAAPPYGVVTADERLAQTVAVRTLQTLLLAALAGAALTLAVVGVYGIIHQSVTARRQEIGVRMALGASVHSVVWMILSGALGLAAVGLALGLGAALAFARTMSSFLYETDPLDPFIYAAVAVALLLVTSLACMAPARRASRVDPMAALRHE